MQQGRKAPHTGHLKSSQAAHHGPDLRKPTSAQVRATNQQTGGTDHGTKK